MLSVLLNTVGNVVRWAANLWSLIVAAMIVVWILVYCGWFVLESRWIALGYISPFWFILFLLPPAIVYLIQRRHVRWISLLVMYLAVFVVFGDLSFFKQPSYQFKVEERTQSISVVALNLRYYSYGFKNIVQFLKQADADIYLLSENDIEPGQSEQLKKQLYPRFVKMGQNEGTAIISRYPVTAFREIKFPTRQASLHIGNRIEDMDRNPYRSFVHAVVDVNGVPVHAISVRFIAGRSWDKSPGSVIPWTFYVLGEQIKEIEFFLKYLKQLEGPIVFGGDLNATPSSVVVQKLKEVAVDVYLQDHLWGGFTFWTNFPAYARLDYIFCRNRAQAVTSALLDQVVSDHYPVYAEILIPAKQ